MEQQAVSPSVEQELHWEVQKVEEMAVVVDGPESYEYAGEIILSLDKMLKRIKEYWATPKQKAFEAHREITRKESEMIKPIEERRRAVAGQINAYLTEQDRIRREEQDRLDRERKQAEDAERARLEKAAEKAEKKGNEEKAAEIREQAETVFVPPVIATTDVKKSTKTDAGTISQRRDVEVRVINIQKLLPLIVNGTVPVSVVTISEAKLKQFVKLNQVSRLDGCEIREVVTASYRGK